VLRTLFFGTPAFAVPTLQALLNSPHAVVGVVTQPDRPSGRGQRLAEPPVKTLAHRAGVPVWQPSRLKDPGWLETMAALRPEVGVVAAYGRILPQVLLDLPARGFVNVHASLLPRYRGASPIQRAIINGEAETGVTIMRVVLALDAGPMLAVRRRPIGPDETSEEVEQALALEGGRLLVETLAAMAAGTATETPQDEGAATYAPRLTKEEGWIDWTLPAPRVHDFVRGLRPWPKAVSILDGGRLILLRGRPVEPRAIAAAAPGTIVEARHDLLIVAAGAGTAYQLLEVQPEGRRAMSASDFLAGHRVGAGARLVSPPAP
jgi:methionyl-tRNA formyltransferase